MGSGCELCGSGRPPFDPCEPGTCKLPDDTRAKRPVVTGYTEDAAASVEEAWLYHTRRRHIAPARWWNGAADVTYQSVQHQAAADILRLDGKQPNVILRGTEAYHHQLT
jgi:hypothetical protein